MHLESFSIELVILAIWKEALQACNSWMASISEVDVRDSSSANDCPFTPNDDHSSLAFEASFDVQKPSSVCSRARREFLVAYDRAQKLSSSFQDINDLKSITGAGRGAEGRFETSSPRRQDVKTSKRVSGLRAENGENSQVCRLQCSRSTDFSQLVGKDALAETDKVILETTKLLREDYLAQNAFTPYDKYCLFYKSIWMMCNIIHFNTLANQVATNVFRLGGLGSGGIRSVSLADGLSGSSRMSSGMLQTRGINV